MVNELHTIRTVEHSTMVVTCCAARFWWLSVTAFGSRITWCNRSQYHASPRSITTGCAILHDAHVVSSHKFAHNLQSLRWCDAFEEAVYEKDFGDSGDCTAEDDGER